MKTVSIIIPAYNAEKYVLKCLESICQQTYREIEILLIDDGSHDKTYEIARKFADNDDRIKVFSNTNHGVSYSRNYGIRRCIGDYITFVDADDVVASDFVEQMVTDLERYDADMAAVGVEKNKLYEAKFFTSGQTVIYEKEEALKQVFGVYEGFVCNKLYKKSLLQTNEIYLEQDITVCEDLLFNVNYLLCCKKVVYNSGKKYFYRQVENSASNTFDEIKCQNKIDVYKRILELVKGYSNVYCVAASQYAMFLCEANYQVKFLEDSNGELREKIKLEKKEIRPQWKNFGLKRVMKLYIFSIAPQIVIRYQRRKL